MFPQVFGKFVLEGELSSGGMARVFLATLRGAVGFEKRLVVKQIRAELASDERFVERFVSEAKTSVELTHPNIVPVYELGVEGGVYYIAMELCPGVTLAELLQAADALPAEEAAYVGVELARALGYAHRRAGIVHRDVTPRNVLIDDEGAVRLIDFGIAAPVATPSGDHEVFGTPGHMPPEQIRGQELTPATDVFALAALLYESACGRAPFRRATEEESLRAVSSAPAPLEGERLAPLARVLAPCFAERPEERPAGMDELGRGLRDILREADVGDVARALGTRVRRVRRASQQDARRERLISEVDRRGTRPLDAASEERASFEGQMSRTFATRPLSLPPAADPLSELMAAPLPEARQSARAPLPSALPDDASQASPSRAARWVAVALVAVALVALFVVRPMLAPSPEANASGPRGPAVGSAMPGANAHGSGAPHDAAHDMVPAVPSAEARVASAQPEPAAPVPGAAAAASPSGAANAAPPGAASAAASSKSGALAAQKHGLVSLTAAPSAEVSIAGRTLSTPISQLELPAGSYRATFRSPTWDGGISVSVEVSADAARSVHADFTAQPPRVVVR